MTSINSNRSQVIFTDNRGIDLQPIMRRVYIWMGLGTLLTAVIAFLAVNTALINFALNPVAIVVAILAELGMVLGLSLGINRLSVGTATILFFVYAALNGFTLSLLLFTLSSSTIMNAFLATAFLFGVMTVFAFTTTMDLGKISTYLTMGVIGLVIAIVINMFLNSGPLDMLISMVGVLIFTALTAYDTQKIERMAERMNAKGDSTSKFGIMGALKLYLDFINLFMFLLRLLGRKGNR